MFEKQHSIYLNKLSEYHVKMSKMNLSRQELDSLQVQLKAEKEILSLKESEISSQISKSTLILNQVARERETISKLVQDNTDLVNVLEFQKISIENTQKAILLDRANALQNRLDFSHDHSQVEALRKTSLVKDKPFRKNKSISATIKHTSPNRVDTIAFVCRQRENLIRQKLALAVLERSQRN